MRSASPSSTNCATWKREIERLAGQLAELDHASPEYEAAAERYSMLQERFHALDGYALDAQVGSVLTGLGFGKEDWTRQTDEFSGGWQMRIALAKLLLAKPNLLLLDEPTNHLDLETRNWLEDYLNSYPFGYILISHDRYFLDVTIDRTVEIWNKRLNIYQGNYTKYLTQKDERRAQFEAAYRNQREQIEHLEAFINRFRAQATKAKQVQSRIKELEKIERIEIPEEEPVIHFKFPQPPPSGRMVVEAEGLAKSYGAKQVLQRRPLRHRARRPRGPGRRERRGQVHAHQAADRRGSAHRRHSAPGPQRGQRILRAGPVQGARRRGAHAGRHQPRRAQGAGESNCARCWAAFSSRGDDVFKPLGVLSGGERNRYALARILVSPSNFLLLDEPTNHLDMRAKDVLLEALAAFSGTVVFVSHDRYFIDRLATRVLEVENGTVTSLRRQLRGLSALEGGAGRSAPPAGDSEPKPAAGCRIGRLVVRRQRSRALNAATRSRAPRTTAPAA